MGTRYYLTLTCPHCGTFNNEVYFAPTSGFGSHSCLNIKCKKRFWIGDDLLAYPKPVEIDMRKHSTWGNEYEEKTGGKPIQILE